MSKRSFRTAMIIVLATVAIFAAVGGWLVHHAMSYADSCPDGSHDADGEGAAADTCITDAAEPREIEVEIVSGMSFPEIATLLESKRLIERPTWFRMFAMWHGKTTEVKTGKYRIKDNQTPRQILDVLVAGVKEVTVKVTLPEGKNMLEFFDILEHAKVANAKQLAALARDRSLLAKYAIQSDSLEGSLFPDTYQFRIDEKPAVVIERLITRHREVWNEVISKNPRDTAKLKDRLGWTDRDILTMASIVEKEAIDPQERPRIAQVFINRLTTPSFKPKRLQTDPTIRYGCLVPEKKSAPCIEWIELCTKAGKPPGCERLRTAQLEDRDNPYNTYQHDGLPPGPIANPGRASILATLSPDGSDYFYFVATSKNSRTHAFARTKAEHERNVRAYVDSAP